MTDIRRHSLRSAIGVACGLLAAVAIIGLVADFGSAPLSGRSTNGEAGRDTAAISPIESGGESAIMRSEEHTSELQSLMRISYAVFCLKKKKKKHKKHMQ